MEAITQLVSFLKDDLNIPAGAISLGLRYCEQKANFLPITLWQYGLVTLDQLSQIFDWLEKV